MAALLYTHQAHFSAFTSAYNTAKDFYDTNNGKYSANNQSNVDAQTTALKTAREALAQKADLSAVSAFLANNSDLYANGLAENEYTYSSLVEFNAAYKTLNDFYNGIADKDDYSKAELEANLGTKLVDADAARKALAEAAADYSAYNALIEAVKQQDMNAFTTDYINSDSSVYGLIGKYGTNAVSTKFNTGVANDTEKTTPTDATADNAYVNVDGTVYKNATQNELNSYVAAIETELNDALKDETGEMRNSYTVTVTTYTNDAQSSTDSTTKHFGDNYDITEFLDDTVTKIVVNGKEYPATTSYTVRIQSDTTIEVYKTDAESLSNKKAVNVQNLYGHSAQTFYFDNDATVTFSGYTFTSGATTYTSTVYGSYNFQNWKVNGKNVVDGTTMDVSAIDTIMPVYTVSTEKEYNVIFDGSAVQGVNSQHIYYDTKVTLTPTSDVVAIAAKIDDAYYVVSYGSDPYTFYGCGDVNFYSVYKQDDGYVIYGGHAVDEAMAAKIAAQEPFVWSVKADNGTKLTTYSTFSHGSTIIEAGTLYTTNADLATEDNFKFGATGVKSVAAKNPNATSSQYWLGIKYGSKNVYTRAYVKYETTVNGQKVQVIDYGNIVSNV